MVFASHNDVVRDGSNRKYDGNDVKVKVSRLNAPRDALSVSLSEREPRAEYTLALTIYLFCYRKNTIAMDV